MTQTGHTPQDALRSLARPLTLTRLGMVAERVTHAFWPVWSIVLAALAALAFGVHEHVPLWTLWTALAATIGGLLRALWRAGRIFRWPRPDEALDRLDRTLPGRPITALGDAQAIGAGDAGSEAVWRAHLARMAARIRNVRAAPADLRISDRDRYGLRYIALTGFLAALLFGSLWRVAELPSAVGGGGAVLAAGPSWEGWVEPPAYTSKPSLYLNDIAAGALTVPKGSRVTLRLYGDPGDLVVRETVSGMPVAADGGATTSAQGFDVLRAGAIEIDGRGGRAWQVALGPDTPPEVAFTGEMEWRADGEMRQAFTASDDYGVIGGQVIVTLDLDAVSRTYGLSTAPEPREPLVLDMPVAIAGDRREFTETIVENLSEHAWAGLPVEMVLAAQDALGQEGATEPLRTLLPGRRFFDPLAKAVVEQRRDLLWSRANGRRVSQVLRAVSYRPEDVFRDSSTYLRLRVALRRLEAGIGAETGLSEALRDEVARALWDIALLIEDGDLSNALERLRRAQERLSEAMRDGASNEEIAELMRELREAMSDYMRQLAEQPQRDGNQQAQNQQDMQTITGDQLQQMLDRLQELMEQGRMAEAQQLLQQLQQMMENMQVAQGQGGQQGPGQQAMEGLADTLRQQQELSDDSFGSLQDQFNGQQGQGQQGQQGQGQMPGQGQGGVQGQGQSQGQPGMSLAERQRALRQELQRQQQNLPGLGGEAGEAARDALDRAGRAMDHAEQELREDDLAGALDSQAEAMDALRDGMRNMGEALAQQQQNQQGQQGQAMGRADPDAQRDPLGRDLGAQGRIGTDENMLQDGDVYGRARELLDELRRRSSEHERPELELDYLRRLLDRF